MTKATLRKTIEAEISRGQWDGKEFNEHESANRYNVRPETMGDVLYDMMLDGILEKVPNARPFVILPNGTYRHYSLYRLKA